MTEAPGFLLYIGAFLLLLGPLVFVHEFGHYAAGRWFGVKAEEFSIGFGREIAGFTDRRGTRWKFGWLPLGGYVRFAGDMNPASQPTAEWLQLPPSERAKTFQAKPLWQRAIIVAAGPFINFVLAILILAVFALAFGQPSTPSVVREVLPASAAARAGMQAGDRITALGGRSIDTFEEVSKFAIMRPGERVAIDLDRAGQQISTTVTFGSREERDRFGNVYRIGVLGVASGQQVWQRVSPLKAPLIGIRDTARAVQRTADGLGQIISGRRSVKELGGPLQIAKVSGERLSLGFAEFIYLAAFISINLGFINLLPVPVLDGGHLMFYAVEAVRRRPASPQAMEWAFRGGLAAILALMLLVTFNDLGAFGVWHGLAGLIG
ncbi:MAG: RIP metalloprotease RseP [Pseudomonadota bacterium]